MKQFFLLLSFAFISTGLHADIYIKGVLNIDAGYRCGHVVPATEVTNEWWFGKEKVTFITTGWNLEWMGTDWRFTLDKERSRIIAANLTEKFFVEVPLPMNLLSHVDQSEAERLSTVRIDGTVKKLDHEKVFLKKKCMVYEVNESITAFDKFYDRNRRVAATLDVPFNWQLMKDLYMWIRSFFNLPQGYLSELKKYEGFVLEEDNIFYQMGGQQIKWTFKVLEISPKQAPKNIYDVPGKNIKKKQRFAYQDLVLMRRIVYPRPLY